MSVGRAHTVAEYWDEHAGRYDDDFAGNGSDAHALRARLEATLRLLGAGPGEILDAGMGPGRLCEQLERQGWTVSGIDVSGSMVALARRRVPNSAARLIEGDLEQLPFGDGTFDAVVATGVLEYSRVPDALAELARVLRPDGHAVVSYPNPRAVYRVWKTWLYYPTVRSVKRALRHRDQPLPRGAGAIPPERFLGLLTSAGLVPTARAYTSVYPLVSPFELLFPRLARALAARLEGCLPRLQPLLATQVVFSARKRAGSSNDSHPSL